jgi:2-polyprenyl-3-methyl-5-hydroxy-6-metoxy-1,4-benzoquinol methylase
MRNNGIGIECTLKNLTSLVKRLSYPAQKTAEILKREGKSRILEIGAGQGRDALFFANNGFQVTALDYSETAVETINKKAQTIGLSQSVSGVCHDIRKKFSFNDQPLMHATVTCFTPWHFVLTNLKPYFKK